MENFERCKMTYATVNVDVEVDLSDVDTNDLLNELKSRDLIFENLDEIKKLINQICLNRLYGLDFLKETDRLIYLALGRIV